MLDIPNNKFDKTFKASTLKPGTTKNCCKNSKCTTSTDQSSTLSEKMTPKEVPLDLLMRLGFILHSSPNAPKSPAEHESAYKEFDTGAIRSKDRAGVRYDLISPIGLRALAETYAEGAEKFGANNWENGMPVTDILNHVLAHIFDFLGGCRKEPHLAHAAWGLLAAIHSFEKWPELNENLLRGPDCACPKAAQKPASR